jgi:predicted porin
MTTSGDYYMKKSLLALAVLGAFAGVAQAQTNVTLYGSIDAGLRRVNKVDAAGDSRWTFGAPTNVATGSGSNGTYQSNRVGFKGVEDLGGGLNAHFTLESGFNSGNGQLDATNSLFNRSAFVGLGGAWGALDLGRQYTVAYKTVAVYDPFNYKFTSLIPLSGLALSGSRLNNDVQGTAVFGPATVRAVRPKPLAGPLCPVRSALALLTPSAALVLLFSTARTGPLVVRLPQARSV